MVGHDICEELGPYVGMLDSYLKMLQSLASHMKLLLDTPEHLWRLIEKKKYLHAAWLFLLARVIHRVLVREDDEDEEGWAAQGIDVTVCVHSFLYTVFGSNSF